ncbi:MAG: O-linked N-acetylglucosamine transferase, SPINDLY family protein [Burkholderiales bacterium]
MLLRLLKQIAGRPRQAETAWLQRELTRAVEMQQKGLHPESETACRGILKRKPDSAAALQLLGNALLAQRRPDEAIAVLTRAIEVDSASAQVHYNLACAYKAREDADRALAHFREALKLDPSLLAAYLGAAAALSQAGRLEQAAAAYRDAISRNSRFAEAHNNLGNLLSLLGRHAEAERSYRDALAADPSFSLAHGALLYTLNCNVCDPEAIDREHRAWGKQHADPLTAAAAPHSHARKANRRLRIAYVSPDLRVHSVGRFMDPVLAHRDRDAFEVWCYYAYRSSDEVSARFSALSDRWIECAHLTDAELAARIRADAIDVAVDLAGHTRHNRLLALARKPAPVQATYLGYPTTTGMAAIDYRITDVSVDPPGVAAHGPEQPVRLPHSYFCFRAPYVEVAVGPLPASATGHVTFGSFNNLAKLSDVTLHLWACVLRGVPDAKLLLKAKDFGTPGVEASVVQRFARAGIAKDRLLLHAWEDTGEGHYGLYNRVDIGLDTYPYNGATTTCEALWMGVPVVTLEGPTHASRMAASILKAAGLPELVTSSPDDYVSMCVALAENRARLAGLRSALREKLAGSHLMDGPAFARSLEDAYRRMWRAWCES